MPVRDEGSARTPGRPRRQGAAEKLGQNDLCPCGPTKLARPVEASSGSHSGHLQMPVAEGRVFAEMAAPLRVATGRRRRLQAWNRRRRAIDRTESPCAKLAAAPDPARIQPAATRVCRWLDWLVVRAIGGSGRISTNPQATQPQAVYPVPAHRL